MSSFSGMLFTVCSFVSTATRAFALRDDNGFRVVLLAPVVAWNACRDKTRITECGVLSG